MILKTLQDAILHFADTKNCIAYMADLRWPDGVIRCPTCNSEAVTFMPSRMLWQCKTRHPKRQFSVKVGTVLEDSPIALGKWLLVMWMLVNCRNGISSHEVARTIGITQKSAWFMLHRLREAMQGTGVPLAGIVEADETYVGGRLKNKHVSRLKQGRYKDKTPVFGMVERGGRVVAQVVPSAHAANVLPIIAGNLSKKETVLFTDDYPIYDKVASLGFQHDTINHTQDRFVRNGIHTHTIENFWSCLKRALKGTYISVQPEHLTAYVQEQSFRFNHRRHYSEQQRFSAVVHGIQGKRLTYAQLTSKGV